jgi:hypothetical protein
MEVSSMAEAYQKPNGGVTREMFEKAISGKVYTPVLDSKLMYTVLPKQRPRFDEAMRTGYLVARASEVPMINAMHLWGEMEQRPCIVVETRGQRAKVWIDFIGVDRRFTEEGKRRVTEALALCSIKNALNNNVGALFSHTAYMPLAHALRFAATASEIATQPECVFTCDEWKAEKEATRNMITRKPTNPLSEAD